MHVIEATEGHSYTPPPKGKGITRARVFVRIDENEVLAPLLGISCMQVRPIVDLHLCLLVAHVTSQHIIPAAMELAHIKRRFLHAHAS